MGRLTHLKSFLLNNEKINRFASFLFRTISFNKRKVGKRNIVLYKDTYLKRCKIKINGYDNKIIFKGTNYFEGCRFFINGNGNEIIIEDHVCAYNATFCIEDAGGRITVGYKTLMSGKIELAATEGTEINIGSNCLFSSEIDIRSGDSHTIMDSDGKRINPAESITVGDSVWVGHRAMLLKGTKIGSHCIVGAGSVLTKDYEKSHAVIAGVPAKIIRENVDWKHERI